MRKLKLFFACLLMAVLSIGQVWGENAPVGTILWAETWTNATTGTSANESYTPQANCSTAKGTTMYGGASISYTQSANSVYCYTNGSNAGGTAPELLLSNGKTWTISGIPTGGATEMTLTYKSNNTKSSVSVTGSPDGISISGSSKSYTISNTDEASTFTLVFANNASSGNTRIDDVQLTVKTAGTSGTQKPTLFLNPS